MNGLLLEYSPALVKAFGIGRIVLFCLILACAILIVITTLLQNEDSANTDVITGAQESYYSKNKGGSRDAKLRLITIICAIALAVFVILYFVSFKIVPATQV